MLWMTVFSNNLFYLHLKKITLHFRVKCDIGECNLYQTMWKESKWPCNCDCKLKKIQLNLALGITLPCRGLNGNWSVSKFYHQNSFSLRWPDYPIFRYVNSRPEIIMVHCVLKPQHTWTYRGYLCFIAAKGHHIWKCT